MSQPLLTQEEIKAKFLECQQIAKDGKIEGSRAIFFGRMAGLAWDAGSPAQAQAIWSTEIPAAMGMPSFAQLRAAYVANSTAFSDFATGAVNPETGHVTYSVPGTAFSNAAGSYAFALDALVRGKDAYAAGGEPEWAGYHGAKVMRAAGQPNAAIALQRIVLSGQTVGRVQQQTI